MNERSDLSAVNICSRSLRTPRCRSARRQAPDTFRTFLGGNNFDIGYALAHGGAVGARRRRAPTMGARRFPRRGTAPPCPYDGGASFPPTGHGGWTRRPRRSPSGHGAAVPQPGNACRSHRRYSIIGGGMAFAGAIRRCPADAKHHADDNAPTCTSGIDTNPIACYLILYNFSDYRNDSHPKAQ